MTKILGLGRVELSCVGSANKLKELSRYEERVDAIWRREQGLFNGTILHLISHKVSRGMIRLTVQRIPYKYFLAKRRAPSLHFSIRPVAVSGLTIVLNKTPAVLFGKRSRRVTQYPGQWELVPSGSIETADYQKAIVNEFVEETGLSHTRLRMCHGFTVIHDVKNDTFDVGCLLLTGKLSASQLNNKRRKNEYGAIRMVELPKVAAFLSKNKKSIVPTSAALIKAWKNL